MSSLSFSQYSTALECLRKYKLLYVDKLRIDGPESGDLHFGSALHMGINTLLQGGTLESAHQQFSIYWASLADQPMVYGRFTHSPLGDMGMRFLSNFDMRFKDKFKLEFAEERLYAEYDGIKVEGTPDFVGTYDGVFTLADFKTSSQNYDPAKIQVSIQLYLYSYLYQQKTGRLPDQIMYFVFNKALGSIQKPLTQPVTEKTMRKVLDEFAAYASIIHESTYPKNLNNCFNWGRKCEYFDKCLSLIHI